MKILIVDDNPDDRKVLRYMIEQHGHTSIEAVDGEDGFRKAKETLPGLIISDALMPVMDGFQFLREVRQDASLRDVPFIFYSSSYQGYQDVRLAMSLGADSYIMKPVEPYELWKKIDSLLNSEKKEQTSPVQLIEEDAEYLKRYSQVVASKLEEKVRELERTLQERERAEEELRKRDAFIKSILESVDEGFIVIDRDFRILSANRAYIDQFSRQGDDLIGKHCYEVSHRFNQPCFERGIECAPYRAFMTGEPHKAVHTHTNEDGSSLHSETKAYPLKDEAGKVSSVIEIVVDITDKAKLEEQLRHAQKMEAVGTLAGGVAHDFNNILTAIIGYGNLVKMKMRPDDPQRTSIDQILTSSERAARLTQGLLAFGRKQVINPRPVDVNDVVRSVEKLLQRLIGEDIELVTRLAAENMIVMADAGQIEQVLMNLATNARDAMPEGGRLSIATERVELKEDFMDAHGYGKPGMYARIAVSDSGAGMDEQTRKKIFEPFFTTKEPGKGTGLGLAIVYGIVKQHDGNINVYSEPGKGTVFKIYVPLVSMNAEQARPVTAAPPSGGTETILIAEDDQNVRALTTSVLTQFGYRVIEAIDGQDAIEKYSAHAQEIHLLILDVIMPRKSGRETYEAVKALRPDAEVVFMSGYTADVLQKKGIFEEGLQFISKPLSPFDLLRKVREILDKKK